MKQTDNTCWDVSVGLATLLGVTLALCVAFQSLLTQYLPVRTPTISPAKVCNNPLMCSLCVVSMGQQMRTRYSFLFSFPSIECEREHKTSTILSPQIYGVFSSFVPLKGVRLIREKSTNVSRGFCFVEFNAVEVYILDTAKSLTILWLKVEC